MTLASCTALGSPHILLQPPSLQSSLAGPRPHAKFGYAVFLRRSCGPLTLLRRQFVRYIQWFITFPLLLLLVLFATGLSLSDILTTCFFAWVVVVCGLCGALTATSYKWGFFVLGVMALFYIWCVSPAS